MAALEEWPSTEVRLPDRTRLTDPLARKIPSGTLYPSLRLRNYEEALRSMQVRAVLRRDRRHSGVCVAYPSTGRRLPSKFGWRSCPRDRRGSAALEFAMVLPMLVTVLIGTMQYGLLMFTYASMLDAARNATRKLAVSVASESQARTAALAVLPSWIAAARWTVTPQDTGTTGTTSVQTTISVGSSYASVLHLVPMPATLTVKVVMRKES